MLFINKEYIEQNSVESNISEDYLLDMSTLLVDLGLGFIDAEIFEEHKDNLAEEGYLNLTFYTLNDYQKSIYSNDKLIGVVSEVSDDDFEINWVDEEVQVNLYNKLLGFFASLGTHLFRPSKPTCKIWSNYEDTNITLHIE